MILEVKNLSKFFSVKRRFLKGGRGQVLALDDISFSVDEFSTLAVAGESGSGKTTLAKIILDLILPSRGEIVFDKSAITDFRKDVQIIFQNPYNSLNPKMRIIDILSEPLLIHNIVPKKLFKDKIIELLNMVGLESAVSNRYPMEFSGGQRQRICIARALACGPKLVVLDEPISSLDLTVQAEMLDLFLELKKRLKLTYIFISHNLAVLRHIADKVMIMHNGRIVEYADARIIFSNPAHPYTRKLLRAASS